MGLCEGSLHSREREEAAHFPLFSAAIDMLIFAYKQLMPQMGGYLSDAGRVHLARTELLLRVISSQASHSLPSSPYLPHPTLSLSLSLAHDLTPPPPQLFRPLYRSPSTSSPPHPKLFADLLAGK